MTITDILITALIAFYATIGGAFMNAAITSPGNCDKLLTVIYDPIRKYLLWAGIIASIGYPAFGLLGLVLQSAGIFELPGVWIAAANLTLMLLLRGCWSLARILLRD